MGFLSEGSTLEWPEAKKVAEQIRVAGIRQFLAVHRRYGQRSNDRLLWGDEVEYILVRLDAVEKTAKLSLRSHVILPELQKDEMANLKDPLNTPAPVALWRPEYGDFMIEGTPGAPYCTSPSSLCSVEANMVARRAQAASLLEPGEHCLSIGSFPLMGTPNSTEPPTEAGGPASESSYLSDKVINHHVRFATLTANIRLRRGKKVDIRIPVFRDSQTQPPVNLWPSSSSSSSGSSGSSGSSSCSSSDVDPMMIHMDAMGFGMGCCCLQSTFQACSINEAIQLYDQFAILSPLMLALTASTPIYRGYLSDIDARWTVISQSCDDRTDEEKGEKPLENHPRVLGKSRYDSISSYLFTEDPKLNDIPLPLDEGILAMLHEAHIEGPIARHYAHLFTRDPLVIYKDKIELDEEKHTDHFENIQSTNWQSVRFKPPPPGSGIGWRVEFRTLEVQLTDFENAAFAVFLVLLNKITTLFELNLYLPLSLVDENMRRAHHRDAVLNEKFYFVHHRTGDPASAPSQQSSLMSLDEIVNGSKNSTGSFPGLIPLIHSYLDSVAMTDANRGQINDYLSLIGDRASGKLKTTAAWYRHFVTTHPAYQHDSIVSPEIAFDLLSECARISATNAKVPGFTI